MEKLKDLVKSRKFWAAVLGVGLVTLKAFRPDFPFSDVQVQDAVFAIVAFILGTGLENIAAAK